MRDEGDLGQKLLHDLGEGDVDRVIVNTCQLEGERDGLSELLEETSHICLDSIETLNLLVVIHEHIRVNFVNEHFVPNVSLDRTRLLDDFEELLARALIIGIVGINDID